MNLTEAKQILESQCYLLENNQELDSIVDYPNHLKLAINNAVRDLIEVDYTILDKVLRRESNALYRLYKKTNSFRQMAKWIVEVYKENLSKL